MKVSVKVLASRARGPFLCFCCSILRDSFPFPLPFPYAAFFPILLQSASEGLSHFYLASFLLIEAKETDESVGAKNKKA